MRQEGGDGIFLGGAIPAGRGTGSRRVWGGVTVSEVCCGAITPVNRNVERRPPSSHLERSSNILTRARGGACGPPSGRTSLI